MSKTTRLAAGEIRFAPYLNDGTLGEEIVLGYNQRATLSRTAETKELLSNDESLGQSVAELETKVTYEFSTEIGDLSLKNIAIAFKGLVETKNYAPGDIFWNGKTLLDGSSAITSAKVGDLVIKDSKIYTIAEAITSSTEFADIKTANKVYKASSSFIKPEKKTNNVGRLIFDGKNLSAGKLQILIIPKINLKFDGDFTIVGDDFAKLSLKGKVLRLEGQELFTLIDGENDEN
ncbi:hypothetical protein [Campylobacter fetus]|uniref:hypothetical protein n=1 Tax=Campylobacter fetus TaxID=196 RepID=UPI00128AB112|nr:hypothetical protein [Campylobacter fetus]EAL3875443.1 hypothetical protein [Campylobacter fetus]EGK8151752.1 hypothetical protein [Campylobacter fetus]EGK8206441.1 hypothetical protein [Campylobacter fetus]MPB50824.1 hypothetical protein [Campylobacter fetus]